jgi:hypothetical protein
MSTGRTCTGHCDTAQRSLAQEALDTSFGIISRMMAETSCQQTRLDLTIGKRCDPPLRISALICRS